MTRISHPFAAAALLLSVLFTAPVISATAFEKALEPFLAEHCYECHDDLSTKGGLDLYALGTDLSDEAVLAKWIRIYDRVAQGEMPPEDQPRPGPAELRAFGGALAPSLAEAHRARKAVVLRRLNRQEYQNTLNDLFGTNLELAEALPEDARSHEFSNVGEALSLSMVQMHRYLDLSGQVLASATSNAIRPPEPATIRASYAEGREAEKFIGESWLQAPDGAVVFFRRIAYPSGLLRGSSVRTAGKYRIRVTGYAYQSESPVTFFVGGTTFARGVKKPTYGYFQVEPGPPQTIELEAWIPRNYMIQIEPEGIYDTDNEIRKNGIESYRGPGLAVNHVEIEGPLVEEYPSRGHRLLFDGLDRTEVMPHNPADRERKYYQPKFELRAADEEGAVTEVLHRIAARAFRRPVEDDDAGPYLALYEAELARGSTAEQSLLTAVKAILCSPGFLYLRESPGTLDDHALAARLSYFLTRSLPDEPLLAAARDGKLARDPVRIQAEADRLLEDPRFERFLVDFTDAWLDLRDIEFTAPDQVLFPEYDTYLQDSMLVETRLFLRELILENLGVANLVRSDFAMLNDRLALHYGIEGVNHPRVQRVRLPAGSPRGGILSQGSILKVSANGTNTSPVVRGVWVMERILGQTPPPPPAGIAGVEPDIRGAETLRDLLDKHRDSETCQSCHEMIDPPGFALESFNPIGGWRDHFRSLGEGDRPDLSVKGRAVRYRIGPAVDASGQMADGRSFDGFNAFRDLLAQNEDALARAFLTKLLTFATGREMGFSDRPEINRIVRESAAKGHGIRDLFRLAVVSEIFRTK